MAEQDSETKGRARGEPISGLFAMVAVLVAATIIAILYFGREVVVPITLAVLLSFLLAPAVRWLRRLRLGRIAAVGLTVLIAFLALAGFAAILVEEVSSLAQELPEYRSNLETKIRSLPGVAPGDGVFGRAAHVLQELGNELRNSGSQQAASTAGAPSAAAPASVATKPVPVQIQEPEPGPLQIVQDIIGPLLQPLAAAGLVVVFVILILLEREDLRDRLLRLAGRDLHRTTEAMNDAAERISRYLLSQLIVNFTCGVPIGLGLAVIGIPNAALWGALVVLLRFIPYLGIVIAAAFPLALAIAVSPGWMLLVWTGLLFVGIETIVANIVEPFVYGGSTGVSPVALIAAATFWTWLWGPIGLLLSTPMTVCLVVLGRHVPQLQFFEVILGNEPVLSPEERFYQRLLAKDPEEATEQVEAFAKERPLADFFDEVALTALARAQADSDRGALSVQNRSHFKETIAALVENLSEDEGEGSTAVPAAPPKTGASGVVCVAGRNDLDEAAALLLAHLLNRERRLNTGPPLPPDTLSSDAAHFPLLKGASVACLSLISTSSPARARYLVRRIRRRAPGASVIVCFWGWAGGETPPDEISAATSADAVAFSLREAIANIDKMPMVQRTSVRAM